MLKMFDQPTLREGFKGVAIIRSFAAAQELVERLSPPVNLLKFPRTPHLLNLGAVTDDDILVSQTSGFEGHVVITEKVDGANLGISLSSDGKVIVQNRSHYVNSSSHVQFKKLGRWVEEHEEELLRILARDPHFPQRFILYGEWLAACHSINYTGLPDLFIAFDFYDRSTGLWADRKTLLKLLSGSTIQAVPLVYEGPCLSTKELENLVQRPSEFYDGRVEGVYLKVEKDGRVAHRGKVVRGDFISGNEHWTKGVIQFNELSLSG
jgi:atypical dual specificity phosphatase